MRNGIGGEDGNGEHRKVCMEIISCISLPTVISIAMEGDPIPGEL